MLKTILPLSFIVASRFFGLFIVMPVLSAYASEFTGASDILIGLLVGVYAIAQMIFQVPFGILSDKIGRKKSMLIGLIVFIFGSLVCATSENIYVMIFGRILQGSGAVGAVAMAMISDFTPENSRGKAMAIMGASIGASFGLSMLISPILAAKFGLSSLFYLSAFLSLICVVLLFTAVPAERKITRIQIKIPFSSLLTQKNLAIMNFTSLIQKMLLNSVFVAIPLVLAREFAYENAKLWQIYVVATCVGFVCMGLAGFLGDGKKLSKQILLSGIFVFALSFVVLFFAVNSFVFALGVVIFFAAFNLHEPIMQSLASKFALSSQRGAALGVFNSFGYLGSFLGGVCGGFILGEFGFSALCGFFIILCLFWAICVWKLKNPNDFEILVIDNSQIHSLFGVLGVIDIFELGAKTFVKYDKTIITSERIHAILSE